MITSSPTGEILNVGQILHPSFAQTLGDKLLLVHEEYLGSANGTIEYTQSYAPDSLSPRITRALTNQGFLDDETNGLFIAAATDQFQSLISDKVEIDNYDFEYDFVVGSPGDAAWHVDNERGYKLLVNLSSSALKLLIALEWDTAQLDIARYIGPNPEHFAGITYTTGQGIIVNNMCRPRDRILHAGVNSPHKVFMRIAASEK